MVIKSANQTTEEQPGLYNVFVNEVAIPDAWHVDVDAGSVQTFEGESGQPSRVIRGNVRLEKVETTTKR